MTSLTELPFDFNNPQDGYGARSQIDGATIVINLASPAWSYGCTFAVAEGPKCHEAGILLLELQVETGAPAIGVLGRDGTFFFDEAMLSVRGSHQLRLRVPPFAHRGALVVRNSAQQVCRLKITALAFEVHQICGVYVRQAIALDNWLEAGRRLGETFAGVDLPALWRDSVKQSLASVAPLVSAIVVQEGERAFDDTLAQLNDQELARLAQALVVPASCPNVKGWAFDWALDRPEPVWQLRAAVWRAMKARLNDVDLALPWLENTTVWLPLQSELSMPLFLQGQYEPNIYRIAGSMIQNGDSVIDIGANVGLFTLFAAGRVGPQGCVLAIEPSPREFVRLQTNVRRNRMDDRIVLNDFALSETPGWAQFTLASSYHSGLNAFTALFSPTAGSYQTIDVPVQNLDGLVRRLSDRRVRLVKIDVEGAEYNILRGAGTVIRDHRPIWIIEIGRLNAAPDWRVVKLLTEAGYCVYDIDHYPCELRAIPPSGHAPAVQNVLAVPNEV